MRSWQAGLAEAGERASGDGKRRVVFLEQGFAVSMLPCNQLIPACERRLLLLALCLSVLPPEAFDHDPGSFTHNGGGGSGAQEGASEPRASGHAGLGQELLLLATEEEGKRR